MNEKEIGELRRRLRPEKNGITHVIGCYVNEQREIVSIFDQPFSTLPQEETENLIAVLRRTLSGTIHKNLLNLSFSTKQVLTGEEHRLLMQLRDSRLQQEDAVQALFQKIAETYRPEGSYLILLAYDAYDIPYHGKDGSKLEDGSTEVFSHVLCSVCPIRETKPVLRYNLAESTLSNQDIRLLVSAPELGFLFPAFNDRSTDIYSALYYTKSAGDTHPDVIDALFKLEAPMAAEEQKTTFDAVLADALAEACSMEVLQEVHHELCEMIEEHKASKEPEPLIITKSAVKHMLSEAGVSPEHVQQFDEKYDAEFGETAALSPKNLIPNRKFEVVTPNVQIRVDADCTDLIETRVLDGVKYILIRADQGVEVNGVSIRIADEAQKTCGC